MTRPLPTTELNFARLLPSGRRSEDKGKTFAKGHAEMMRTSTTQPLLLDGKSLFVNAHAEDGSLRVAVLPGEAGAEVRVFTPLDKEHCLPVTADGVRQEIRWNTPCGLSAHLGKPVRLRFHLDNAALYSLWTE